MCVSNINSLNKLMLYLYALLILDSFKIWHNKYMKILNLNTQKAYQATFDSFITDILRKREYDFILLQEVTPPVVKIIKKASSEYQIVNPFDPELGENTHVCVLYKSNFVLQKEIFLSFATLKPGFTKYGWGFVGGLFDYNQKKIFVGSAHLHPGLRKKRRVEQVKIIKKKLMEEIINTPTIFGGDFNFGLPGEISVSQKVLSPEFIRVTKNLGPTLDSRYTEKSSWGIARIANILMKIGISIKLKTDHVYMDNISTKNTSVTCTTLPSRVSDHLAIEIYCNDIK